MTRSTASMAKQDVSPPSPLLCCNLLELIGGGDFFFFADGDSGFFLSFLLFYLQVSDGQTLKPLICIQPGPSKGELRTRRLASCLAEAGSQMQEATSLSLSGFCFSLSVAHFGRKLKFAFRQNTKV